jgi:hypothetical protein
MDRIRIIHFTYSIFGKAHDPHPNYLIMYKSYGNFMMSSRVFRMILT